ncbi:MAG: penicillin acylase family protein [Polaromonas sp.]
MVWFKRFFWLVLALLIVLAAASGIYINRSFPALSGELKVNGLKAPVSVTRDAADVTHIKAQSPVDAWFAIGYVHAQERGWQLEFNRRVMHGELSEAFGTATLDTDKLLRTLGIMQAAERQWQGLPAEGKNAMQAYSDGINAFYEQSSQALSPEFHILGVKPGGKAGKPWTPQDSIGWSLMMALDLGGNWGNEFARLSALKNLSTAQLWQLFTPYPGEQPASKVDFAKLYAELGVYKSSTNAIKTGAACARIHWSECQFDGQKPLKTAQNDTFLASNLTKDLTRDITDWASSLGTVDGKGSNNWVVAGNRTTSGKPLLANDPHLGLSAPAIWYFAHLEAPGLNAIGATLPGMPFVVLGRTDKVAWGFTNTGPDVQDLYLEQINPANPKQYRVPSEGQPAWADFKTRNEVIKVKGQPDVQLTVRESRHGPVLSDAQKSHGEVLDTSKYVLTLRWGALDADNQTVLSGLRSNNAQSIADLEAAFSSYHSPMQSVVMADVTGKTAFKAVGKLPLRKPENDIKGIAPAPGWDARYDWAGWATYAQTPQSDDAAITAKGYLATANQRITPPDFPIFMGQDWTVPYRQDRIEQMLAATPKHDMASMQKIQADQLSMATLKLLPFLTTALGNSSHTLAAASKTALKDFDGVMRAESAAPLIFAAWVDELTRGVIGSKLGEASFKAMYGKRNFRPAVEGIMARNDADWCGAATCAGQSSAALGRALTRLQKDYGADTAQWSWGRAHNALSAHKPFGNVPLLAKFFDVRVPTGGDTFTVNVGQYWANDDKLPFANRHAASMRTLFDLADLEKSQFIYQTGQSGLVFSSRYRDMSEGWAKVEYRALQMNPAGMVRQLRLVP